MNLETLKTLNTERRARRAVALVTALEGGAQRLVRADAVDDDPLSAEIAARFRSGRSGTVETDTGPVFLTVHVPPPRLVAIGAVHISQALAPMAKIAGFDMMVVDPRTAFATPERFPDVRLIAEWPEDVAGEIALDRYTALAALTHDPKIDDWPIMQALDAGCFYVGALGSRKTHGKRRERLLQAGVTEAALSAIHAPIGLDVGAQSPAEIAVAVLAEIVAALRREPEAEKR